MKKFWVCTLFSLALLGMSGCGGTETTTVAPTYEATASPTKEPTEEPTAKPTEEPTLEPTATPTPKVEKIYEDYLYSAFYSKLTLLDGNNEPAGDTYVVPEGCIFCGMYLNSMVLMRDAIDEYDESAGTNVVIVDILTGEEKVVFSSDNTILNVDVYNDLIFVDTAKEDSYTRAKEYAVNPETGEVSEANSSFLAPAKDGYHLVEGINNLYCNAPSIERILSEKKFTLWSKDGKYFAFDGDGIVEIECPYESPQIYYYDSDKVLLGVNQDEAFRNTELVEYDVTSQTFNVLLEGAHRFLDYRDGSIFYGVDEERSVTVHSLDIVTKEDSVLYREEAEPGMDRYTPGVTDFIIKGDDIMYIADDGTVTDWYKTKSFVTGAEPEKMNVILTEYPYLLLGTVEAVEDECLCPYCGKKVGEYYGEYFVLSPDSSEAYKAINKALYEKVTADMESAHISTESNLGDETACEYHYPETTESYVSGVEILNDKFVAVNTDGSWYGGGAHGMPLRYHGLFDIKTGKEITVRDYYKGTEEELKKLIAEKTRMNYEMYLYSGDECTPYFATDGEEVYNQAYETISFECFPVSYHKDGITIEYAPYIMGPYAAGYIEVEISYEELGAADFFGCVGNEE